MKNIFYIFALVTLLAACNSKSSPDLESNKDLMILTDPSMNGNYLADTGVVATAAMRNSTITPNTNGNTYAKTTRRSGGSNGRVYGSSGGTESSSGTGSNTSTRKKGISKAAKGAIIGGVGGATVGAVIGKNGKGAVIGGVIGAAGGYIIGRKQDKKDGRVQ